jgi:hypothetical protein
MHLGTGEQLQVVFINWLLIKLLLIGLWIRIFKNQFVSLQRISHRQRKGLAVCV